MIRRKLYIQSVKALPYLLYQSIFYYLSYTSIQYYGIECIEMESRPLNTLIKWKNYENLDEDRDGEKQKIHIFAKLPCLRSWLVDYSWLSLCLTQQNYCQTLIIPIQWFVCLSHLYIANFYLFSMPWISFQQFIQSRFNDSENDTQYICTCSQNVEKIQRSI